MANRDYGDAPGPFDRPEALRRCLCGVWYERVFAECPICGRKAEELDRAEEGTNRENDKPPWEDYIDEEGYG